MTSAEVLALLQEGEFLDAERLAALQQRPTNGQDDATALLRELVRNGDLTSYQANEIAKGRGRQLLLGPYLLLEPLGQGGMGQVFKARQRMLGRIEALKLIKEDLLKHPSTLQRFRREVQAVAALNHPNIVQAYSADHEGNRHFLAMELLDGIDLGKVVQTEGPLSIGRACACVRQAALGLQHAFERGMVHRDIKPTNLFLVQGDRVKVLDFGLARILEKQDGLTTPGMLIGTPDYMAPEQLSGEATDIRTDIHALGCTLYFLLTGRGPFPSRSLQEAYAKRLLGVPEPVEQVRANVPPELAAVLRRMLARDPAVRPAAPVEVARALEPFLDRQDEGKTTATQIEAIPPSLPPTIGGTTETYSPPQAASKRKVFAGLAAGLVVLAGLLLLWNHLSGKSSQDERRAGEDDEKRDDKTDQKDKPAKGVSLGELDARMIPAAQRWEGMPTEVVAVLGERQRRHPGEVRCVACSPDGKLVASGGEEGLVLVWDAETGVQRAILRGHQGPVQCLGFTRDGVLLSGGGLDSNLIMWDLEKQKAKHVLSTGNKGVKALALSRDGKSCYTGSGAGEIRHWDLGRDTEKDRKIPSHTRGMFNLLSMALSPDGKLLAYGGTSARTSVYVLDLDSGEMVFPAPKDFEAPVSAVGFTADGKYFVLTTFYGYRAVYDVKDWKKGGKDFEFRIKGTKPLHLALASTSELAAWTIDEQIYAGSIHVNGVKMTLKGHKGKVHTLSFLPSGDRLVSGGSDGTVRWWRVGETSGEELFAAEGPQGALQAAAVARDGKLAAVGSVDGAVRVWPLQPGKYGKAVDLSGLRTPVTQLAFLADQRLAVFREDGVLQVFGGLDGEPRERLRATFPKAEKSPIAFSADGKCAAVVSQLQVLQWDLLEDQEKKHPENRTAHEASALAFDVAGKRLAVARKLAAAQHEVFLWDLTDGMQSQRFATGERPAVWLAFSEDGQQILSITTARGFTLTDTKDPKLDKKFADSDFYVWGAFVPDGRQVVALRLDGQLSVWNTQTGVQTWSKSFPLPVRRCALVSDGRHVLTANADGTAYVIRLP